MADIAARDQARQATRSEIQQNRQGRSDTLDQMAAADQSAWQNASGSELAQAAAVLTPPEARLARRDKSDQRFCSTKSTELWFRKTTGQSGRQSALAQSAETVASEKKAIENKSTFNAFAIRGLVQTACPIDRCERLSKRLQIPSD